MSIGETGKKMKMPKAPQMKLQQNDVVYSAYVKDAKKLFHLNSNKKLISIGKLVSYVKIIILMTLL